MTSPSTRSRVAHRVTSPRSKATSALTAIYSKVANNKKKRQKKKNASILSRSDFPALGNLTPGPVTITSVTSSLKVNRSSRRTAELPLFHQQTVSTLQARLAVIIVIVVMPADCYD